MSGDEYARMVDAEWDAAEAVYLEQCDPRLLPQRTPCPNCGEVLDHERVGHWCPPSPEGAAGGSEGWGTA